MVPVSAAPPFRAASCVSVLLSAKTASKATSSQPTNVSNALMDYPTASTVLTLRFASVVNRGMSWMRATTAVLSL